MENNKKEKAEEHDYLYLIEEMGLSDKRNFCKPTTVKNKPTKLLLTKNKNKDYENKNNRQIR